MEEVWSIVADDLTGAADAGAPFVDRGYSTIIWLHGHQPSIPSDIAVYETSSRHVDPPESYSRVTGVVSRHPNHRWFKKLDSTLHGNLVAELRAVYDAARPSLVVLAPSHPLMGRTLRNGVLYVHGEPAASLPDLLSQQGLTEAPWLRVCDCDAVEDLQRIVSLYAADRCAFAGAGALAQQIAARLPRRPQPPPPSREGSTIIVVRGSTNPVTERQIEHLAASGLRGVEVVSLRRDEIITTSVDRICSRMLQLPLSGMVIVGGDTARAIATGIGAHGLRLSGERIPGVPWGQWIGGPMDGLPVATKAGGFGADTVLTDAVRLLALPQ